MTLGQKQEVFTHNIAMLILKAEELGFKCRGREWQRTIEQQERYVAEGKSKTMKSKHLDCIAVDMYFTKEGKLIQDKAGLQALGDYWESLNASNSWGGNWKSFLDCPHFEMA